MSDELIHMVSLSKKEIALLIAAIDNLTSEVRDLKKCLTVPDYNDMPTWKQAEVELNLTDRQEQN